MYLFPDLGPIMSILFFTVEYVIFNISNVDNRTVGGKTLAVFNQKCRGFKFNINDVDHNPPHCHVNIGGRNTQIDILTLEILNPPPYRLPTNVRRCAQELQEEMLEAWDSVKII
jgi:hypothetical protein